MNSVVELGLPLEVVSEDTRTYTLDVWQPSLQDLDELWEKYENYRILFSDIVVGNKDYFIRVMIAPTTIVLDVTVEGEKVGVVYITDIRPKTSADAHYFFWDKKTAGRQRLVLTALKWAMDELDLHRVNIFVPRFAYSALHRIYRMRFRIEGIKHEALLSRGKWIDIILFGVLRSEVTEEALQNGYLGRTDLEKDWFDLLNQDEELMRNIVYRRAP